LLQPEIAPNTGNIGRLCLGLGLRLHLVGPLGFQTDTKAVRRAGLDYWRHVDVTEHPNAGSFWAWAHGRRFHLFSARDLGGQQSHLKARFQEGDVLVFGCESRGLPTSLLKEHGGFRIPMTGPIRSLNLANAVAVVAYAALAQVRPELF
jgi:tRNA (cytidine/uridine-2'-O-)-methyltransferase